MSSQQNRRAERRAQFHFDEQDDHSPDKSAAELLSRMALLHDPALDELSNEYPARHLEAATEEYLPDSRRIDPQNPNNQ